MDADDALIVIARIAGTGRVLSDAASLFLVELGADLLTGRAVELTQEDVQDLRTICRRVGVAWEASWSTELEA